MPILHQVQKVFQDLLLPYKYEIDVLKKYETVKRKSTKKMSPSQKTFLIPIIETLKFEFKPEDFKHLLGLHKTLPCSRYTPTLLYTKILHKQITYSNIPNPNADDIAKRIIHFLELTYLLNDNISKKIYYFDSTKYPGRTQIKSKYIIYLDKENFSLNFGLGIDPTLNYIYPETWFVRERKKDAYILNQDCYNIIQIRRILK